MHTNTHTHTHTLSEGGVNALLKTVDKNGPLVFKMPYVSAS